MMKKLAGSVVVLLLICSQEGMIMGNYMYFMAKLERISHACLIHVAS